jgi:thiamine pyrophosphokinase
MHKYFWDHISGNSKYRSILCASGELPDESFFQNEVAKNLPIIAIDGAVNYLVPKKIIPDLVIGDLDSARTELLDGIETIYILDQSKSDLQKALAYLEENNLLPSIIVGFSGGYIDHIINNINIFLESNCIFYAPPIIGYNIPEGSKQEFELPHNSKISLLGIPSACVSTTGLKWDLDRSKFSFPGDNSCFNRSSNNIISIEVHDGNILVLVYLVPINDAGGE